MLAPSNLYTHIFAVKIVIDPQQKSQNIHLEDVGLRGISKIDMVDSQAYFSTLKFESTSYNNDGVKFHLLLVLYIQGEDGEQPKVLLATISPHIFVDSRKSARDNQQKKFTSFIEPFPAESLEKQFIKRQNKKKNQTELRIQNDFDGFLNYLTAPNIRHKVKHPIFLVLRFSKSAVLFYNKNHIPSNEFADILESLQNKLIKDHTKRMTSSSKMQRREAQRTFIMLIQSYPDSHKSKKVFEAIEPLESPAFHICFTREEISPEFTELKYKDELLDIYKKNYPMLNSICRNHASEFFLKNEEDSSQFEECESDSSEEHARKRVHNEIPAEEEKNEVKGEEEATKIQQQNTLLKNLLVNKMGLSQDSLQNLLNEYGDKPKSEHTPSDEEKNQLQSQLQWYQAIMAQQMMLYSMMEQQKHASDKDAKDPTSYVKMMGKMMGMMQSPTMSSMPPIPTMPGMHINPIMGMRGMMPGVPMPGLPGMDPKGLMSGMPGMMPGMMGMMPGMGMPGFRQNSEQQSGKKGKKEGFKPAQKKSDEPKKEE